MGRIKILVGEKFPGGKSTASGTFIASGKPIAFCY
jgi:hypothetical protein